MRVARHLIAMWKTDTNMQVSNVCPLNVNFPHREYTPGSCDVIFGDKYASEQSLLYKHKFSTSRISRRVIAIWKMEDKTVCERSLS